MALARTTEALAGILFYFVTISSSFYRTASLLDSIYILSGFTAFSLTHLVKPK
jgi:hypothetical protein